MRHALRGLGLAIAVASSAPAAGSIWPGSHERIVAGLASTDIGERRGAAARLLELPPKRVRDLARTALHDEDVEVRLHAARAAVAIGLERAGDDVVSWLQERDPRLRATACEVIQAAPSLESVAALGRVLSDARPEVRLASARAMGASGLPEAVPPLLGRLDDPATEVRVAIVRALGRLGDRRAAVPLITRLQDLEGDVRWEAAHALGVLRDSGATAALELALQDKEPRVVAAVLEAIGRIGSPSSVTALVAVLRGPTGGASTRLDGSDGLRETAVAALARIPTPEAVRVLVAELEREGPLPYGAGALAFVREALASVGAAAVPSLVVAVETSSSPRLASAAALTLGTITARHATGASIAAVLRGARRGVVERAAALHALGRMRDAAALPFVLEHIEDPDFAVRAVAIEVAAALLDPASPDGRVVDIVQSRLVDTTAPLHERAALAWLLGRTGSPRAAQVLVSLFPGEGALSDDRADMPASLRIAVADALSELGAPTRAIEASLLAQLRYDDARVRAAAARALGRVASEAMARELVMRLEGSAEDDRAALAIAVSGALARVRDPGVIGIAANALRSLSGRWRDAVLEGLGRSSAPVVETVLDEVARSGDVDDRRKIAEAVGGWRERSALASRLVSDPDPGVRANAVWSLGGRAEPAAFELARAATTDLDVAVAGNAAIALARMAVRTGRGGDAAPALCAALNDPRPYVQLQALTGLRAIDGFCGPGVVRRLLASSRHDRVRAAAASWIVTRTARERARASLGTAENEERRQDELALVRCALDERDAGVARACRMEAAPPLPVAHERPVVVHIVPVHASEPTARAPFALVLADGALRLGVADRRGIVFESSAPEGNLELAVPATRVR